MGFFDYSKQYDYPIFLEECLVPTQTKIFRELINKYHSYVKYVDVPQRRIHYLIYRTSDCVIVGAIGLSSCVLAISVRDKWIGWDKETRLKHSNMVANNYRFCLIKDNITIKNVGTMALKLMRTIGATRWESKYGDPLILIETFIKPPWNGSVYRADNWIDVGMTKGSSISKVPLSLWKREDSPRGKMARENPEECLKKFAGYQGNKHYKVEKSEPKIIMLKPLVKKWKKILSE